MRETIGVAEAADILGVSEWTVYSLARQKIIPHVRMGRRVMFRRTSLEAWLEEREAESLVVERETAGIRRL